MEDRVLRELPPLLDSDFMYVADRRKKEFRYLMETTHHWARPTNGQAAYC